MTLAPLACELINRYQGGFPLVARPFAALAGEFGVSESGVIGLVRELVASGVLSRFGPIFDASRLGGGQTLAALTAPEARFDAVAEAVNALPAVAHNYRREHALNMWFVVAAPTADGVGRALAQIEQATGLKVYDFPKLHEFYLGLWLQVDTSGAVDTVPVPLARPIRQAAPVVLDPLDLRLVEATQSGLPLTAQPYLAVAEDLGVEPTRVIGCLARLLELGVIRRIGAVPNHYRLGLRANGMTVWDVPDELAVELGEEIGALDFVSHSYLRPRHPGVWPYNLFAMVHGRARDEVLDKAARIAERLGSHCRGRDILFSSRVLKKTGLRLAA